MLTEHQASVIRSAISSRLNIVISGGTGSGKTTLANAIIAEIVEAAPDDRLVILEDTAEIQCAAENAVALHTSDAVDMARLLKSTMRLRPDRIIVGEVRDGAALTLLKAWNTGHPGGVTTIHSNTALSALRRLEQLTAEVSQQPMQDVIGEASISSSRSSGHHAAGACATSSMSSVSTAINTKPNPIPKSRRNGMSRDGRNLSVGSALSFFFFIITVGPSFASSGGGGLPWESPLQQIQQSITGPVAGFIALAAVAIAGGMLIFGGELNDFARRLVYVVLVAGILLGSTQIIALFGATGASIGAADPAVQQVDHASASTTPLHQLSPKGEGDLG